MAMSMSNKLKSNYLKKVYDYEKLSVGEKKNIEFFFLWTEHTWDISFHMSTVQIIIIFLLTFTSGWL